MISGIRFGAMDLKSFPKGKTQIARDSSTGKTYTFSDYEVVGKAPNLQAKLKGRDGQVVATVPVRQALNKLIADCLNAIGAQG